MNYETERVLREQEIEWEKKELLENYVAKTKVALKIREESGLNYDEAWKYADEELERIFHYQGYPLGGQYLSKEVEHYIENPQKYWEGKKEEAVSSLKGTMWLDIPIGAALVAAVYLKVPEDPCISLLGTTITDREAAMISLTGFYAYITSQKTSFREYLLSRKALKKLEKAKNTKP